MNARRVLPPIPGARESRELLRRHGLKPKTSIGQHFVTDPNTVRKVVRLAGVGPGDQVLEVGPGLGALSLAILETGASLIAIERDRALEPVLTEMLPGARIVWGDALAVDLEPLLAGRRTTLVANLPYQIATTLVLDLLEHVPEVGSQVVMVQREVGERLAAAPGTEAYGAVSVKIAYLATAEVAMRVSRRVFLPMPDVESVVVRLDRREQPPVDVPRARLWPVIEAGFGQRRKTIRRALVGAGWTPEEVEEALRRAAVEGRARGETLALEAFAALASALPER